MQFQVQEVILKVEMWCSRLGLSMATVLRYLAKLEKAENSFTWKALIFHTLSLLRVEWVYAQNSDDEHPKNPVKAEKHLAGEDSSNSTGGFDMASGLLALPLELEFDLGWLWIADLPVTEWCSWEHD